MSYAAYKARLESCLDDLMDKEPTQARIEAVGLLLDVICRIGERMEDMPGVAAEDGSFDTGTIKRWVDGMDNADGTRGAHWTQEQTTAVGRSYGVDLNAVSPECWWAAMCMMYSDYYPTATKYGLDREDFYAALAKDFVCDRDGGGPKAKLKGYYFGVVQG